MCSHMHILLMCIPISVTMLYRLSEAQKAGQPAHEDMSDMVAEHAVGGTMHDHNCTHLVFFHSFSLPHSLSLSLPVSLSLNLNLSLLGAASHQKEESRKERR